MRAPIPSARSSWSNSNVQLRFTEPWLPPVERKKRSPCDRIAGASFRASSTGSWAASVATDAVLKGPSGKGWKYPSHDSATAKTPRCRSAMSTAP